MGANWGFGFIPDFSSERDPLRRRHRVAGSISSRLRIFELQNPQITFNCFLLASLVELPRAFGQWITCNPASRSPKGVSVWTWANCDFYIATRPLALRSRAYWCVPSDT